jgi:hypothetical protein
MGIEHSLNRTDRIQDELFVDHHLTEVVILYQSTHLYDWIGGIRHSIDGLK